MDVTDKDYENHLRNQIYKRRMMSQTSPSIGIYDSYSSDGDDAIRPNVDKTTDPSVLEANISAFVQRIEQMAPRVDDIEVMPRPLDYSQEPRHLFGSLVTQLFQLAKRITYGDMSTSVPVTLQPNHICELAHISFDIDIDIDVELNPFVQLSQRSALTLQSLIVGYNSYVYPNDFFVEPGGGYLVYPRLLTLKLLGMHSIREGEYPAFPGAVPFPNLRHLYMEICYPFSDDTLFRGNSATLEYLNMELDHHSCPVLYEYNVFSPGSHPKLWCVDVTLSEDVMPDPDADTVDYLEYVLSIGSEASVRTIKGYVDDNELASALYLFEDYSCIRVLSLPGLRWLELMDIIELIECLPLLTDLTTSPTQLRLLPEDITDDELPEYLTDVYAPLSERFRSWSFMQTGVGDEVVSRLVYAEFDDEDDMGSDTYSKLQLPLLWVCHNFRAFVYERFCKRYYLDIRFSDDKFYGAPDFWLYHHQNLDSPTHQIAKELTLRFDARAVYSGKAIRQLSMAPFEGCPFPQVRELLVELHIKPKDDGDENIPVVAKDYPLEAAANMTAFVQRLQQMAPRINKVDVDVFIESHHRVHIERCSANDMELAWQLFGIADAMAAITSRGAPLLKYMDLEPLRSLVCIDIELDGYTDVVVPVVRRNTQTLQVLAVSVGGLAGITGLIQNTGVGDYLEYPCLHTLKLYKFSGPTGHERPIFPGAIPFPNLQKLTLRLPYLFGDDVVFRGNAATLMHLDMEMDLPLMTIFKTHDVFTLASHPKLHCVIIDSLECRTTLDPGMFAWCISIAFRVGPEAPVRGFGMPYFGIIMLKATPTYGRLECIQVLLLPRTTMDHWEVLALLKLLPILSDLTTLVPTLGEMPTGITNANLQAYVISRYSPMAKRFRCWRFETFAHGDCSDPVICVLLVALACPNFDYAVPCPIDQEDYGERLEEAINTRG
ncbi:hypothetical protein H4S04_008216, partial [Coemansia sp. S16]